MIGARNLAPIIILYMKLSPVYGVVTKLKVAKAG